MALSSYWEAEKQVGMVKHILPDLGRKTTSYAYHRAYHTITYKHIAAYQ